MQKGDIWNSLIEDSSRPTTFKKRYIVENQKLFRVSKLEIITWINQLKINLFLNLKNMLPKC